jgi:tRNA nucleotidyltransferase/poly(A) polymerase
MALDPGTGRVIDLHGGLIDLKGRTIRCVGNPEERFREDYLRMLRAIRFATAIEGEIERLTWEALCKQAEGIDGISRERVRDELMRLLTYPQPSRGFLLLRDSGLLTRFSRNWTGASVSPRTSIMRTTSGFTPYWWATRSIPVSTLAVYRPGSRSRQSRNS